jgi:hypothetical protein
MARSEKREDSVLFSLRELRQIAESRVQKEEHAVRTAEQARIAAAQDAERRRIEAEEGKERAEREAQIRVEQAREHAEREARLRVESAEAVERQRQQAALEQQRLLQEIGLRLAEAQRRADPATPQPGDVLSPPREHTDAHRIGAGPNKTVMLQPSEGVVSVARTENAVPPQPTWRADPRRPESRWDARLFALAVLMLLALCVLLFWIF